MGPAARSSRPKNGEGAADTNGAEPWTELEAQLHRESHGFYQPTQMRSRRRPQAPPANTPAAASKAGPRQDVWCSFQDHPGVSRAKGGRLEPCGRVSVVTPSTGSRQDFHPQLYACFEAQEWADKELVVVETHRSAPSPFFTHVAQKDPRIVFLSVKIADGEEDFSIGLKRNMGLHLSSGEWVASFDDDDLYAPGYVAAMLREMVQQQAMAITLGAWYVFEEKSGSFGYVNPRGMDGLKEETRLTWGGMVRTRKLADRDEWLYGFGFSYVFSRVHAVACPFPDKNLGEDYDFFRCLKYRIQTALLFDEYGICIHTMHSRSTSSCQAAQVPREEIRDLDVAGLGNTLLDYIQRFPRLGARSDYISAGKSLAEMPRRAIVVHSSQGDLEVARPCGCAALDVKRLLAPRLGLQSADVLLYVAPAFHEPALADTASVSLRTRELWAVLPIDLRGPEEVTVVCMDATANDIALEVRVISSAKLGDVKEALFQQHCGQVPKDQRRRLRLARRSGNAFVGVDEKLPLGEVRTIYAMGLGELLGAPG